MSPRLRTCSRCGVASNEVRPYWQNLSRVNMCYDCFRSEATERLVAMLRQTHPTRISFTNPLPEQRAARRIECTINFGGNIVAATATLGPWRKQ